MRERWVYYMLFDKSGLCIGFSRESPQSTQYADLRTDHWHAGPILYDDRVILHNPPEGLRTLRPCK